MASTTFTPGPLVHGASEFADRPDLPRHRLGDALHVARVFAVAAVEVVLLGRDAKRY